MKLGLRVQLVACLLVALLATSMFVVIRAGSNAEVSRIRNLQLFEMTPQVHPPGDANVSRQRNLQSLEMTPQIHPPGDANVSRARNLQFFELSEVWSDDDNDGLSNYLDVSSFNLEQSTAPLARVFQAIDCPVEVLKILPSTSYGYMMEELYEWGVKATNIQRVMLPVVIDLGNFGTVMQWARTNTPLLVTDATVNEINKYLCSDGHLRYLFFFHSDLELTEVVSALGQLRKALTEPDLWFDLIARLANQLHFELYQLRGSGSVKAEIVFDFTSIAKSLETIRRGKEALVGVFTIAFLIVTAIGSGGTAFLSFAAQSAIKLFNFALDFIVFDMLEIRHWLLDWLKVGLTALDPPQERVVLHLYNITTGELLLGYNQTSESDISTVPYGLYSSDNDSAIMILSRNDLNHNFTVSHTPGGSTSLPYTLIAWDCPTNSTFTTGGFLEPDQATSTIIRLENDTLTIRYVIVTAEFDNQNPITGDRVAVSINVTDNLGNPLEDTGITLAVGNKTIPAQDLGAGEYNAMIDTSGLEGLYSVTIFTTNMPEGCLQGMATYPLKISYWARDVGITSVTTSKTVVGRGYIASINVIIFNYGNDTETVNITILADQTIIGETYNIDLTSRNSTALTLTWNTSGFVKGNYTISAIAEPVPLETETSNNNLTGGWVIVAMIGDITGPASYPDGKIDVRDVAGIASRYGAKPPDPKYDANWDITGPTKGLADGKIDVRDVALVASRYGQKDP